MAKSPAPFLSINPSGSIAGLLTASRWKGRPYLRLLVTPSNPRTEGQLLTRVKTSLVSKAAKAVLTSFVDSLHTGSLFFVGARDAAPSGQSWVSFLQQAIQPLMLSDIRDEWVALSPTQQGYFTSTASDIGLVDYVPSYFPSYIDDMLAAGAQLYALAYFTNVNLSGDVRDLAVLAIAAGSQGAVDDFGDAVHLTSAT